MEQLLTMMLIIPAALSSPITNDLSLITKKSSIEFTTPMYEYNAITDPTDASIQGASWTIPVTIGGQTLNLLVDTGSSDL